MNLTLVVMAAGIGSRFGGLKQLTPVGPSGEFIIDYSVYDAIYAGFNKVVFVIKKENLDDFKNTIGNRMSKSIKVEYVFQSNKVLPNGYSINVEREKPLGTAHAVYCTKDVVSEPFVVITADDFYGRDAFVQAANFLKNNYDINSTNYAMVSYSIGKVINDKSSVKRGICRVVNGKLDSIVESSVEKINGEIIATSINSFQSFKVSEDTPTSMSFFIFYPSLFKFLERDLIAFLKNSDLENKEFFLPDVVDKIIKNNEGSVSVLNTNATWYGVTYKEDLEKVKSAINKLINNKVYNKSLW
ncbi:MAG: NTP transferase domain-containing protein [Bacilli bacterium]|nr:NTP transferase domain-containing protein [Bacilli bacterium]